MCWTNLQLLLILHSIVTISKLDRKLAFMLSSEKRIVICKISHFTTFSRILVFNHYKRIGRSTFHELLYHGIITMTQLKAYSQSILIETWFTWSDKRFGNFTGTYKLKWINMTPVFLKKIYYSQFILTKLYLANFCISSLFQNTFSIH